MKTTKLDESVHLIRKYYYLIYTRFDCGKPVYEAKDEAMAFWINHCQKIDPSPSQEFFEWVSEITVKEDRLLKARLYEDSVEHGNLFPLYPITFDRSFEDGFDPKGNLVSESQPMLPISWLAYWGSGHSERYFKVPVHFCTAKNSIVIRLPDIVDSYAREDGSEIWYTEKYDSFKDYALHNLLYYYYEYSRSFVYPSNSDWKEHQLNALKSNLVKKEEFCEIFNCTDEEYCLLEKEIEEEVKVTRHEHFMKIKKERKELTATPIGKRLSDEIFKNAILLSKVRYLQKEKDLNQRDEKTVIDEGLRKYINQNSPDDLCEFSVRHKLKIAFRTLEALKERADWLSSDKLDSERLKELKRIITKWIY